MLTVHTPNKRARLLAILLAAVALAAPISNMRARAQIASVIGSEDALPRKAEAPLFRMETFPVGGGAELLTVFGSLKGLDDARDKTAAPGINATTSRGDKEVPLVRSEEHTSELQHANISYAVFCLKKKKKDTINT